MYIHHTHSLFENADWFIWAKRIGWLCLLVLLVKGVVWLTLPMLLLFVGIGV